jgi:D-3-phosphoglycerate dehydrogenase
VSELGQLPSVYGTHHVGASTAQAQDAIAAETVRILASFVRDGTIPNCVNVARRSPARARLMVRHHDRVGVLANVLGAIREAGINVQEVQNTVFDGATAACCAIQLDERPGPALLELIRSRRDEVISVDCFDR